MYPRIVRLSHYIIELMGERTRLTFRQENFQGEGEYKHANFFWGVALYIMKLLLEGKPAFQR